MCAGPAPGQVAMQGRGKTGIPEAGAAFDLGKEDRDARRKLGFREHQRFLEVFQSVAVSESVG